MYYCSVSAGQIPKILVISFMYYRYQHFCEKMTNFGSTDPLSYQNKTIYDYMRLFKGYKCLLNILVVPTGNTVSDVSIRWVG